MELKAMLKNLSDAGCTEREADVAKGLYESGMNAELVRYLRKCRCSLLEEMHQSQRKVDLMDILIRQAEREAKSN